MTIQVRCYKTANNGTTAVASIAPGYTGWTAVAPYANTAPVVGDLIVVVGLFTLGSGNVTQSAGTGSYTFTTANGDANAATQPFTSWCAYRQYTTGDTGPTFHWSGTTTAYCYLIFALTSSVAGSSVTWDASGTPKVDATGATAHTPNTASASVAFDAAIVLNAARYQTSGSHAISMTTPCVGYSAIHIAGYAGTTSQYANSCSAYMDTPVGPGTITPGSETFNEAVANNAYTLLASESVPPYTGGPQGWSSPAGIRAAYVPTGICMASLIPSVVAATPPVITTTSLPAGIVGQPYSATLAATGGTGPYTWSISSGSLPAGLALNSSTGVISGTPAGGPGPVFFTVEVADSLSNTATQPLSITILASALPQAIRAHYLRLPVAGTVMGTAGGGAISGAINGAGFGSGNGSRGAPLRNPGTGPVFRQAVSPARARITPPPRGRTGSNPGTPVKPPVHVSPVYPLHGPVRAKLLPPPLRGRMAADWGVILFQQPQAGPAFTQAVTPARARITPPPRGRIMSSAGKLVVVPRPAKVYPAQGPVRARTVPPFSKGRTHSHPGAPLRNPGSGPVFRQAAQPARARIPQVFSKGRAEGNPGTPVPPPLVKPPFRAQGAVQAKQPLPRRGACRTIRFLPVSGQPQAGPAFQQATQPARIRPSLPPRGRIGSNPGVAVLIPPPPVGPVFTPKNQALRARLPQQPLLRGRVSYNPGSVPRNPNSGPVFIQRSSLPLVRPLPRRGTCRTIKFLPIPVPPPLGIGPPFIQATSPARARITPPPRGRIVSNPGGPVRNPQAGPVFRQAVQSARIRPQLPPRGRIGSNKGTLAPVFQSGFSSGQPAGIRVIYLHAGRTSSTPAAVTPRNPNKGPAFRQATQPARTRITLPPRGRVSSNPGGPLENPIPPVVAVFFPKAFPARARIPQDAPRGRVYSHPGAPVRNPQQGPAFRQAVTPARIRPSLPPRGRIGSNPGGPVRNSPPAITGLFNIVFPCARLTSTFAIKLPAVKVSLSGNVTRLALVLPPLKASLAATVLHQPLHLIIPKPAVSLTAINFNGRFAITLPAVKVTLTGGHGHVGSFSIILNICSGGMGGHWIILDRNLPQVFLAPRDEESPGYADYVTGSPYTAWSAGAPPQTRWAAGSS